MQELSNSQRDRVINDIINHKSDTRCAAGEEYTDNEIDTDIDALERRSDKELVAHWNSTVGEWLCSIGGEYPSFSEAWLSVRDEYENPAEWQFEKLLEGEPLDYNYNVPVFG